MTARIYTPTFPAPADRLADDELSRRHDEAFNGGRVAVKSDNFPSREQAEVARVREGGMW